MTIDHRLAQPAGRPEAADLVVASGRSNCRRAGSARFSDGLSGAYTDNNGYALAIVMVVPFLLATAQNLHAVDWPNKWAQRVIPLMRKGLFASVPLSILTIVGTYSRGGLLGLIAGVMVYILFSPRRLSILATLFVLAVPASFFITLPSEYSGRMETISTYEEVGEGSALSRLHFWKVARNMAGENSFGVGLRQYESAYDQYDFSYGFYGKGRAVHSSHFQVLAELGYSGMAIWLFLLGYTAFAGLRVRKRSKTPGLTPEDSRFLMTSANAILGSTAGFFVGGAFIALAMNDITWYTFALMASLDRLSVKFMADAKKKPETSVETGFVPRARRAIAVA